MAAAITTYATIDTSGARTGAAQFVAALASMRGGVASTQTALAGLSSGARLMHAAFASAAVAATATFAKSIVQAADSVSLLNARLGLVARDGVDATAVLNSIAAAAERARTPALDLAQIYRRNANAMADMGRSQAEGIRFSETLAKVVKISGVSAGEASAAMLQLSQALVSGRLQGDEFRSVAENLPEVLRILMQQSGMTGAQLRKLATDGRLSAEMLTNALLNASSDIDAKFAKVPVTAAEAWSLLTDQLSRTFGTIAANQGVSRAWADTFNSIRSTIASPEMRSGFEALAGGVKTGAEAFQSAVEWIREARIQLEAWHRAISETTFYKTYAAGLKLVSDGFATLAEWRKTVIAAGSDLFTGGKVGSFATFGASETTSGKAEQYAAQLREAAKWQTTVIDGAAKIDALTSGKKLPVRPGAPDAEDATRKAQRVLEIMKLQNDLQEAHNAGDVVRARAIENELEARQKISDEMRNVSPTLVERFKQEVRITNELERQKKIVEENRRFGEQFTSTLTNGIRDAIVAGDKLNDTFRKLVLRLVEMVVQTSILGPLAKGIGNSFANMMGGNPISNLFGLGGDAGLGSWAPTITPFAKGGVFDSPVALSSGGRRGVMAEAGPEAIMPLKRGTDGSLGIAMAGGRSGDTHVTINVAGDATAETVEKMRRVARDEFTRGAPGVVRSAVSAVASEHRADPSYLRR